MYTALFSCFSICDRDRDRDRDQDRDRDRDRDRSLYRSTGQYVLGCST